MVDDALWRASRNGSPTAHGRCWACGARPDACIWRCSTRAGEVAVAEPRLPGRRVSLGRRASRPGDPARARDPRPLRPRGARRARRAALARPRPLAVRASARRRRRRAPATPYAFLPPRATACIRFRSAPSMPASSSPAISASTPAARRWCGSRSGSATSTRASSALMRGASLDRAARSSPARDSRRQHGRLCRSPSPAPPRRRSASRRRRARVWLRGADGRTRAARQSFRRHRRDLQRRRLRADARPLRRAARAGAARRAKPRSAIG